MTGVMEYLRCGAGSRAATGWPAGLVNRMTGPSAVPESAYRIRRSSTSAVRDCMVVAFTGDAPFDRQL
jgi:hypothetical protein